MVRLSDVFIPAVYGSYMSLDTTENDALIQSGIIARNTVMDRIARGGAKEGTIPFWKDLDRSIEQNYSNDDPADRAVPHGITTGTMKYRKSFVNQSYASMDLVNELLEEDPLEVIKAKFDGYWIGRRQRRLLATLKGVFADNAANDGGDMIVDISAEAGEAARFNADAFLDAQFTLGDKAGGLSGMVVHSAVMRKMVGDDEVETIRDSEGKVILRVYRDKFVMMDDTLPVTGVGPDRVYTSYLFGAGAFGFAGEEGHAFAEGEGIPAEGSWVERDEQSGNGGGSETIGERKTWLLHPFGFEWVEGTLTEFSPTDADLGLAAHWNRVVGRKNVPLAAIKSKA